MREDHAIAAQRAGKAIIWGDEKLATTLWVIFPSEHASDASIVALTESISELWSIDQEKRCSTSVA
jgi:hypothetical protein